MILLGNGKVFTRSSATPYTESGAVVIDEDKILEVGEYKVLKEKYPDAEFIDANNGLIMPGLINVHTHIYSGLARGLSIPGNNPTNFLEVLEGTWWKIDRNLSLKETKASAYATLLECIKNGVTTIYDHHASFGEITGSLFRINDACSEFGMRACLCYETSDRDGEAKANESIKENADFIRYAKKANSDMIKGMFGGHALFTISDKTFEKMVHANEHNAGYHIHVSEGMNDVYDSLQNYGCKSVNRLLQHGILGDKTILGHCIHISQSEMDIIKETNTMVVNNPESNMGNAVGCAPVLQMMKKGITVGMGTDAYTHDMLQSLKVFLTIQRHNACMPNVAWGEAVQMLFENNAKMASNCFGAKLGVLEPGAKADVIVVDYSQFTPLSEQNLDGHIIFGMVGKNTNTTIINGKLVYHNKKFINIDEEEVKGFVMEQSKSLWRKLGAY